MNKLIRNHFLQGIFLIEVVVLLFLYFFGTQGLPVLLHLKHENILIEQEIEQLKNTIEKLENNIKEWQDYSFYKEKVAREQLQMARAEDYIYYLPNEKG